MYDIADSTLSQYLQNGEGETLEFKEILPNKETLAKIFTGFANNIGGTLLVGISDHGDVIGSSLDDSINRFIVDVASNNCEPPIRVKILELHDGEKDIITIHIPKDKHLHSVGGRCFLRVGSTIRRLTMDEIQRAMFEKGMLEFDKMPVEQATIDDIDEQKVRWFLRKANIERNLDIDVDTPLDEVMKKLNLTVDGKIRNAGILMFGKSPQDEIIQSEVRCARFKGTKAIKPFIDMKVLHGSLYDQIDQAEKFVLLNTKKSAWLEPGKVERVEKWEYPSDAIREAITNAICHRDYSSSGNVQIRIFDDRIEIWNPGILPEDLTIKDIKGKHESKPRNKILAKMLFFIKYIEEWGTGTNDIINYCLGHGLPEPDFKEIAGSFVVTIKKFMFTDDVLEKMNLTERQLLIIGYLRENKTITNRKYQELTGISKKVAYNDLTKLQKKGIITKLGKGRSVFYVLINVRGND